MKQVIILFGPPGAGKGTQAELLTDRFSLFYLETSKVLERKFKESSSETIEVEGEKFDVSKEEELWKTGKLCSPPFVTKLIQDNIHGITEQGESLIMAGSPRTAYEAERIIPSLLKFYKKESIKVIFIEVSPEVTIFRNSHRRICELIRHPVLYNKETEKLTLCPLDGSELIKRKELDDPETIKVRLEEYKNRTMPILELFEKYGVKVHKINGEQSVADVFKDILKILK